MTEPIDLDQKPLGQPHWRQLDIVTPEDLKSPLTVIGAGAVGSITALCLAKMGAPDITVYDFDTVEDHNYPNQYFRIRDIGRPKVEALREIVKEQSGTEIKARNERYEKQKLAGLVITAVDSMAVRKAVWQRVRLNPAVPLLIDPRMGGEVGNVYLVKPIDPEGIKAYEATLYTDEQAVQEKCTARAVIYNVAVLGGIVACLVKKAVRREPLPREVNLDLRNLALGTLEA